MRIAHGNAGHAIFAARDIDLFSDNAFAVDRNGDLARGKFSLSHIDLGFRHFAVADGQTERFYSAECFDGYGRFSCFFDVVHILADTANGVSAHLSFTAVNVEHTHFYIGNIGRADQNYSVAAYPEMPV